MAETMLFLFLYLQHNALFLVHGSYWRHSSSYLNKQNNLDVVFPGIMLGTRDLHEMNPTQRNLECT